MLALVVMLGCSSPESTGVWMESGGFGWDFFNHRISHVELGIADEGAFASIVGGTSTTGVVTVLGPECDPDTCQEFPFFDNAEISLGWARVTSTTTQFGVATADLEIDADGEALSLTVPLAERAKGTPTAVIRGFSFDTIRPLAGGPACYQPANGWLPKSLGIELGAPTLSDDGRSVTLDVMGHFEAGVTFEEERQCLDAVVDQAVVGLRVDVLVAVTRGAAETLAVEQSAEYGFPGEQPDPDWAERSLGTSLVDPLVGWSAFTFTFHEVGESRGAYLRTLFLRADVDADIGSGHATNFSPPTQLSAFDYMFEGSIQAVDVGEGVERGEIDETIEVQLDDEGVPVVFSWPL